ncbi:unnamed protein product, partial [Urochloa humidicola]
HLPRSPFSPESLSSARPNHYCLLDLAGPPPTRSSRVAARSRPPQLLDVGISAGASRRRRGWGRAPSRSHDGAAVLERAGCGDAVRCRHHGSHTRRRDTNSEGLPGPKPPGQPVSTGGVGERQGDEYNAGKGTSVLDRADYMHFFTLLRTDDEAHV